MKSVPALAIAAIITVVLVLLIAGRLYTSNADYNLGNPYSSGYSAFYSGRDVSQVYHLSDLPSGNASGTALLVISPIYRYRAGDAAAIESYLANGGTLVVIDRVGESESLLNLLNTSTRRLPGSLYQEDKAGRNITLPVITNVSDTGLTMGVSQIYTHRPAALKADSNAIILASANGQGWVYQEDENVDGIADINATYPIIAMERSGSGSLMIISDPDIFSNGMIGKGDNNKIAANIFSGKKVYLDLTHSPGTPTLMRAIYTVIHDRKVQLLLIAAIFLLCITGFVVIRYIHDSLSKEAADSKWNTYE